MNINLRKLKVVSDGQNLGGGGLFCIAHTGVSGPSLLIESTDSMIFTSCTPTRYNQIINGPTVLASTLQPSSEQQYNMHAQSGSKIVRSGVNMCVLGGGGIT